MDNLYFYVFFRRESSIYNEEKYLLMEKKR